MAREGSFAERRFGLRRTLSPGETKVDIPPNGASPSDMTLRSISMSYAAHLLTDTIDLPARSI